MHFQLIIFKVTSETNRDGRRARTQVRDQSDSVVVDALIDTVPRYVRRRLEKCSSRQPTNAPRRFPPVRGKALMAVLSLLVWAEMVSMAARTSLTERLVGMEKATETKDKAKGM